MEYLLREPLKPEIVRQSSVSSRPQGSRDYLLQAKIVQNMKSKWEEIMKLRNPSTPAPKTNLYPRPVYGPCHPQQEQNQEPIIVDQNNTRPKPPSISQPAKIATPQPIITQRSAEVHHDDKLGKDYHEGQQVEYKYYKSIETQTSPQNSVHNPMFKKDSEIHEIQQEHDTHDTLKISHYNATKQKNEVTGFNLNRDVTEMIQTNNNAAEVNKEQEQTDSRKTDPFDDHINEFHLQHHGHHHNRDEHHHHSFSEYKDDQQEGLVPVVKHSPIAPILPHPINDFNVSSGDDREDDEFVSRVGSSHSERTVITEVRDFQPYYEERVNTQSGLESSEAEPISVHDTNNDHQHRHQSYSVVSSEQAEPELETEKSDSSSSIALEVEGVTPRRATLNDDELIILHNLNKDFNETIQEEMQTKSDLVLKSKSENNITHENATKIIKTLSHEEFHGVGAKRRSTLAAHHREYHICHKCKKLIESGEAIFQFDNGHLEIWHQSCFCCKTCGIALGHMDHLFYENEPYCYEHYVLVAHVPMCHACSDYIFDTSYTAAAGHFWHKEHFDCEFCHKPLVDTKFVAVDGHVYCFECHQKEFERICQTCKQKILPREPYMQSGHYFWHSNDSCLHCESCKQSLVGHNVYFRKGGKLYCNRYCALGKGFQEHST